MVGDKIYIFGGEDIARRPLGDLHILDLEKLEWIQPEVKGKAPSARSAHVATACGDRLVIIYGGGSMANCFNDLHILDTKSMAWIKTTMKGRLPSPRAGHTGGVLGNHWYIVGGGNNASGCTDMAYLDLTQLNTIDDDPTVKLSWTLVGTIPERSIIASEGMSLITVPEAGVLVSFGGYNGKYSNSVSIFRPGTPGGTPATRKNVEDSTNKPEANGQVEMPAGLDSPTDKPKEPLTEADMQTKLEAAWREAENAAREAAAAKETAAHELALMRRQLMTAQTSLNEKEKALEETKGQLQTEQSKSFKLEAEVAELRHKLQHMVELEKELETYRRQAQESQKGSGIWGFISG